MFLDPDPKRQKQTGSGFFASQRPVVSPRDRSSATWRRKNLPLEERSQSENNQQNPGTYPLKPTVRLVKPLPESPTEYDSEDDGDSKENRYAEQKLEQPSSSPTAIIEATAIKPGFRGSTDYNQGFHVSDTHKPANEAQTSTQLSNDNLIPSASSYAIPRSQWHRRSGSSGRYSNTSTLRESGSLLENKSLRPESRISDGTTLRGTPTPTEQEFRQRIESDDHSRQTSGQRLEPLEETSPERPTVRIVATPPQSSSSNTDSPPEPLGTIPRPRTSPSDSERDIGFSRKSSRRTSSTGSLPALHNISKISVSRTPRHQRSEESVAQSEASIPGTSSPNIVPYYSDSSRTRSRSQPLQATASIESIQSRLNNSTAARPATSDSRESSNSWSSRPPTSDTLPPLPLPRKRVRHKAASTSLNRATASSSGVAMEEEDIDTQPYPRHAFSMHLSTIASESDPQSRTASQHLSHFSLGSGVLTGDDSSSIPRSGTWPRQRRESVLEDYAASEVSPIEPSVSPEDEPGDMTMGVFREESAVPQPLFRARSPSAPLWAQRKYDGPLPPLPPVPNSRDNDEHFDTVPELSRPSLREQRSGYSLRRRSQSTPSRGHSRQPSQASESSRWSQGANIFPTWAKAYYVYGATLLSSSQIDLSDPVGTEQPQGHYVYKINRDWTSRSLSSGWGTSDAESLSPASSRFLPSIFRPRAKREKSANSRKWKIKTNKSSPPQPASRDSMAISRDPLPSTHQDGMLPGPSRYGRLQDESEQHRPLQRKYSKQKKWDEMQFPRPMSKDELTGYIEDPHLLPNKRVGKGMSAWRAPSFAESLDTLVRSRCNRQILLFVLGFICPLSWMIGSVLPLPKKPMSESEYEKARAIGGSEEDIQAAMMKHEAGDAEKRWTEERQWLRARCWRYLNRIMSVIGILVIGAIIALVIVATTK